MFKSSRMVHEKGRARVLNDSHPKATPIARSDPKLSREV